MDTNELDKRTHGQTADGWYGADPAIPPATSIVPGEHPWQIGVPGVYRRDINPYDGTITYTRMYPMRDGDLVAFGEGVG